jgi:hypothetical protein
MRACKRTLKNRGRLEDASCECCGVLTQQIAMWQQEASEVERKR